MKTFNFIISKIYAFVILLRNQSYNLNILKKYKSNKPIISVGNLTVGGSSKTPMVEHIVNMLKKNNYKPCIVSRGYKRKNKTLKLVIINKNKYDIDDIGDEAFMMSKKLNDVPIIIADNKTVAIDYATKNLDIDVIILDDGFQSIYINRDLDILMVNSLLQEEDYNLFPLGLGREPIRASERSDVIITTKNNLSENFNISLFQKYCNRIIESSAVFSLLDNSLKIESDTIKNMKLLPVCGIADPNSFIKGINNLDINIINPIILKDHHHYSDMDIINFQKIIKNKNCDGIVTTYKDYYKIKKVNQNLKIFILKMDMKINDKKLQQIILEHINE